MTIIGIIPARYASSRFPGKPLVDILGKSMLQRVYEQALKATKLDQVIIATDDIRIRAHALEFGAKVVMTSSEHKNGTERCREVYERFAKDSDFILNVQGDEPFIAPEQIDLLAGFISSEQVDIATLYKKIEDAEHLFSANTAKVIHANQRALYFSRQAIPHIRNEAKENWLGVHTFYKHVGLYAYKASLLPELADLAPSLLEQAESLEQLRWLEHGYSIGITETDQEAVSIDTPEDLANLLKKLKSV